MPHAQQTCMQPNTNKAIERRVDGEGRTASRLHNIIAQARKDAIRKHINPRP